jgi:hypothetical protein
MNQDKEHLRLLAIFHYVVASLAALFSPLPLADMLNDQSDALRIAHATAL